MAEPVKLHIRLLGTFRVWSKPHPEVEVKWRRKAASLVKLLALAPEHKLPCEKVLETLWPDLPESAALNNLHQTLHLARSALLFVPASFLLYREKRLTLGPAEALWMDVDVFLTYAAQAKRSQAVEDYEAALSHYTGDLLPEDQHEDWVAARREELCSLYLDLLMALGRKHEEESSYAAALEAYHRVLDKEPALEEAHLAIMRIHHRLGQRHKVIQQYEELREALRRELDAEPERETQAFYELVLASEGRFEGQVSTGPLPERHDVLLATPSAGGKPGTSVPLPSPHIAPSPPRVLLSKREREVAHLIARGLTNLTSSQLFGPS